MSVKNIGGKSIGTKNIVVVGLGVTSLSVIRYLLRENAATQNKNIATQSIQIRVMDTRSNPPHAEQLPTNIPLHTGGWQLDWLLQADLIIVPPGIALATPELQQAKQQGIEIIGDVELFARAVDVPVIGITGSNGKSTVTALLGEMAKSAGINVGVGGNIGLPVLDMLAENYELYIIELSSFQLETTSSLKMKAATFLNLSEDHLDRYSDMAAYAEAKMRIFQMWFIIPGDWVAISGSLDLSKYLHYQGVLHDAVPVLNCLLFSVGACSALFV